MSANIKAVVKEKYGEVALRVLSGEENHCCNASLCCGKHEDLVRDEI